MTPQIALDEHDDEIQADVERFESRVSHRLHQAEILLLLWLTGVLIIRRGVIAPTAKNVQLLEYIPSKFDEFLQEVGFDAEVAAFVSGFGSQLDAFGRLLRTLDSKPLAFTQSDLDLFVAKQRLAVQSLTTMPRVAADRARDMSALSLNARIGDVNDVVGQSMLALAPRLRRQARLEITTFYRSVADQGYQLIEQQSPGSVARYAYVGPGAGDPVIRPFCKKLMEQAAAGRTWTRAEIDAMDNGQLPNVFVTGGGYECRHQFKISLEKL